MTAMAEVMAVIHFLDSARNKRMMNTAVVMMRCCTYDADADAEDDDDYDNGINDDGCDDSDGNCACDVIVVLLTSAKVIMVIRVLNEQQRDHNGDDNDDDSDMIITPQYQRKK